jgi:hypothetical protein
MYQSSILRYILLSIGSTRNWSETHRRSPPSRDWRTCIILRLTTRAISRLDNSFEFFPSKDRYISRTEGIQSRLLRTPSLPIQQNSALQFLAFSLDWAKRIYYLKPWGLNGTKFVERKNALWNTGTLEFNTWETSGIRSKVTEYNMPGRIFVRDYSGSMR